MCLIDEIRKTAIKTLNLDKDDLLVCMYELVFSATNLALTCDLKQFERSNGIPALLPQEFQIRAVESIANIFDGQGKMGSGLQFSTRVDSSGYPNELDLDNTQS